MASTSIRGCRLVCRFRRRQAVTDPIVTAQEVVLTQVAIVVRYVVDVDVVRAREYLTTILASTAAITDRCLSKVIVAINSKNNNLMLTIFSLVRKREIISLDVTGYNVRQ